MCYWLGLFRDARTINIYKIKRSVRFVIFQNYGLCFRYSDTLFCSHSNIAASISAIACIELIGTDFR